jgi:F-type H+-transporting ATPase subunit a
MPVMNIYQALEHAIPIVIQGTLLTGFLLVVSGFLIRRRIAATNGGIVPDEGFSLRNVFEVLIELIADLAKDRIGPEWRKFFPFLGTMFLFILVANLLGLVPGVGGPTADANTTWAWAVIAWMVYTVVGIAKHKHNYLVKFMGPSFFEKEIGGRVVHFRLLMPIFLILELPLDLARIFTLAVRLLANMFADHTVIMVMLSLVPIGVPAIFMGLGLIISFLQAFIFTLLTMIYIGLALEEPH